MSGPERGAWIRGVLIVVSCVVYSVLLIARADGDPVPTTPYADLLLAVVGAAVVVAVVAHLIVRRLDPEEVPDEPDVRDREIDGRAQQIGGSLLVIGAIVALALAMADVSQFWIAQTIVIAFAAQGILTSLATIGFYRAGVPGW